MRLQERSQRLSDIRYDDYAGEVCLFLEFLSGNSYTASLLEQIEADREITFDQWVNRSNSAGVFRLPKSAVARAKVCLSILTDCLENTNPDEHFHWAHRFDHNGNKDQVPSHLAKTVVDPLINYLRDRMDESSNVLYLLQRFKARTEWFKREELNAEYITHTSNGEKRLDHALRESLFEGGIDYPFSEPSSPSGKADIVASLGSDDPLVLEVKVFDPKGSRDKRHIRQGFHQVLKYANDYNESVGYLVVFNCSTGLLSFQASDGEPVENPPKVVYGGKTIYLIAIDIGVDGPSASKESPASRFEISYEELTEPAS